MANKYENKNHLVGELPSNQEEAQQARNALVRLVAHFYTFPSEEITGPERSEATRRLHRALEVYSELSLTVSESGIREEDREMFIMDGLKGESLIDQTDPNRAVEEYHIISKGYDLNRKYWDDKLGSNGEELWRNLKEIR